MKMLSNTEAELKKSVTYKKKRVVRKMRDNSNERQGTWKKCFEDALRANHHASCCKLKKESYFYDPVKC